MKAEGRGKKHHHCGPAALQQEEWLIGQHYFPEFAIRSLVVFVQVCSNGMRVVADGVSVSLVLVFHQNLNTFDRKAENHTHLSPNVSSKPCNLNQAWY